MEGSRMSRRQEREAISNELDRIIEGLDADPRAAERRCARMSERDREEVRGLRLAFAGLKRACRSRRVPPGRPGRRITFRLEGGKLVREAEDGEREEVLANEAVGEPSSPAAAASGSEDELCSAFGSARF
ncbi:unnamed protein product [Urochloa decumbens]|uniref:Uncharacterized protein n=1 Tax=Urochloa decumbens TaxID=240449 RepID=A0ABC9G0V8_9POAL